MRDSAIRLFGRYIESIGRIGALGASLITVALVLFVTYGMIMRYIARSPVSASIELAQMLFIPVVVLGVAYTQAERGHVRVEMLVTRVPRKTALILELVSHLMFLFFCAIFVWASWQRALGSFKMGAATQGMHMPTFAFEILMPLGVALLCAQLIVDLGKSIAQLYQKADHKH